ncbi:MAG TPA: M1 family metallopeptidase [Ignavibacteriaceae bacterium]|nr:M1 family metallopeptidase [Ignavibacteriaceae bacterium]
MKYHFLKIAPVFFLFLFLLSVNSLPQTIFETPLSNRIASYDIDAALNPEIKIIEGFETLHWKNTSNDYISELQFHLYLNAFKNSKSTFMKESGGQLRGMELDQQTNINWGWIDVLAMKIKDGEDLTNKIKFIHPDDDNTDDQTVISVALSKPVRPGETINLNIKFRSKLPKIFARTGFADDYFLVGQWFPKIGVYEYPGIRYAIKGGWNCHQFHANSEFYADFGVYNVNITLPEKYIVGAVGLQTAEKKNNDGTKTLSYHAEDVIDFAWTASPIFKIAEGQWENVKIKVLLQPEHFAQADRHIQSAKAALAYLDKYVGKYPFPNLTIVDPPLRGLGSAGMEYMTFITAGCLWGMPDGIRFTENVVVHEFGHNYFMGLLATNEFEEAWMDEGFNSYYETRIMDNTYGEKTAFVELGGYHLGDLESQREGYTGMNNPKIAENFRTAWGYKDGGYGSITYNKTATWMTTLDRLIGRDEMDEIMKTYFEKWHFKHPCASDFIAIVNEIVKKRLGNKFGENMNWYFDQVLYGSNICDYKLASISVNKIEIPKGVYDSAGTKMYYKYRRADDLYHSKVVVYRLGEISIPVEILVHFDNGKDSLATWDGKERTFDLIFEGPQKVVWAKVDPENKIQMDVNLNNNSYTLEQSSAPFSKYMTKFIFWVENLVTSMSMIF